MNKILLGAVAFGIVAALSFSGYAEEYERDERPPEVEQPKLPDTVPTTADANAVADAVSNADAHARSGDVHFKNSTLTRVDDAIDLVAILPVGVCTGASTTASAQGADGLIGGALGFGRAGIDKQCTLRENIRMAWAVAEATKDPNIKYALYYAILQLDGFEWLWLKMDQHRDCRKWAIDADDAFKAHNCQYPDLASRY